MAFRFLGCYGHGYVWFADGGSIMMQRKHGKSSSIFEEVITKDLHVLPHRVRRSIQLNPVHYTLNESKGKGELDFTHKRQYKRAKANAAAQSCPFQVKMYRIFGETQRTVHAQASPDNPTICSVRL